jgi:two-component system, cell cycle sensor histidine kinase and response regulator CckA
MNSILSPSDEVEQRHRRQREAVRRLIQSKSFYAGDCAAVIRQITETAALTLSVGRVSIWQYNKEGATIRCLDLFELNLNRHTSGAELSAASYPGYFRAMAETEIIAADDARQDPRTREFTDAYLVPHGITSMLDAPIHVGGVIDGVLCHEHIGPAREWTEDEKSFAVTLANLVTLAAEGAERQRAEAEARKNEERFAIVARATNDVVWDWDLEANTLWWNENFETLFGHSRDNLGPGLESWYKGVHPEDLVRVQAGVEEVFKTGAANWSDEYRFRCKDGTYRYVFDRGYVLRNLSGRPTRIIGAMMDITERKRAEIASRESEARLQAVWENASDALRLVDENGTIIAVNAAFCRLFAMNQSELEGQAFTITYAGLRDPEELQKRYRERFEKRDINPHEERSMVLRDGRIVVLEITSTFVESPGQPAVLLGLFRDITERKEAELALRNSEKRFSEVFRANPAAMSLNTVEGGLLIDVNDRYCEFFGYTRKELIGNTISKLQLWANPEDREKMIRRLRKEGTIREMEAQYRHKSGAIRDVLLSVVFIEVPGESEPLIVSMFTDVTERKRLEEQLRQSQKMDSIGQLAGGVAHDFNNILTVIQGHASLLMAPPGTAMERGDSAEQIARSAERAANLTRQLLAFSRRQVMQPKDLDLNDIVRDMTRMLNRILGEDIRLQVEFSANIPLIRADPGMMEQVILNLAVNARDAMPKGGLLLIRNAVEKIDDDFVRQNPDATTGTFVRLTVSDNGGGIPAEILTHVFEPFFTTKEVGKGTGLGLATVYGIVKQHRGWIKVQSEVNHGTTFDIFLPASDKLRKADEPNTPPARIATGTETILIVEDELSVRLLTRRVLEKLGYTVLEAHDGSSALELWRQNFNQIDLVLTDMVMPGGMSGLELVPKLVADKPEIRVILCSGHSVEVFGKELSLKPGMNFLQKPYDSRKLAEAIRACLDS